MAEVRTAVAGALEADLIADLEADDDEVRSDFRDFRLSDTQNPVRPTWRQEVPFRDHTAPAQLIWPQDLLFSSFETRKEDSLDSGGARPVTPKGDSLFLLSQPDRSQLKALLACAGNAALLTGLLEYRPGSQQDESAATGDVGNGRKTSSYGPDIPCPRGRETAGAGERNTSDESANVGNRLDEPFLLPLLLRFLGVPMYGHLCCVSRSLKEACEGRYSRINHAPRRGRRGEIISGAASDKRGSAIEGLNHQASGKGGGLANYWELAPRLSPVDEAFTPENGEFWLSFLRRRFAGAFSEELELLEASRLRAQGDKSVLESGAAREARQLLRTAEAARQEARRVSLQVELRRQKLEREERIAEHDFRERQAEARTDGNLEEPAAPLEAVPRHSKTKLYRGGLLPEREQTRLEMCARSCFSRGEPKWGSQGAFDSGSRLTEKSGEMYHGGTRDERGQDRESVADLARGNRRQNVRTEKKGMRHRVCRSDSDSGADVFSDPTCVRVLNANGESSTTDRIKRQRIGDEFYHLVSKDTHMDTVPPATTGFMEPFCDIRGCRERAAAISRTTEKPLAVDIVPVCDDESVGSAAHKVAEVSTSSVGEPRHPLTLSCIERGAELPPERGRQGGRDRFDREHRGDGGLTDASVEDAGGNRENQARDASRHILQTKRESLGGDFGVSVSGVVSNRRNVVGGVLREKKESTFPALGVAQRNDSCSRCSGQTQDAEEGESLLESEQSTRLVEEEGGRSSPECAFSCSGTESSPTAEEDVLCGEADRERRESDTSLSLWSQLLKEEEELRRRDAAPPSAFIALWREGPRRRSSAEGLLGAGTDDVDALLRCTSAHLSCVILVTSSKIMERWRELGLSAGWRWFQRKVLRRMTRAQLKRWAVKGDAGTTASATRRKNVFGPREAETMTDAEASTADLIELPEELAQSSDHIAWKMTTANWELLYESVQAEMGYRARLYSEKLLRLHEHLVEQVAELIEDRLDLEQHLLCLPCFSGDSGRPNSGGFTGYEDLDPLPKDSEPSGHQMKLPVPRWKRCIPLLRKATTGAFSLIRGLNEVWDEYEEWAEMVCHVLDCLDFRITQEREACDQKWPHTPNLGDVAKLQFRTFCIFDSRLMPCICVSVYALIHELEEQLGRSSVDPSGPETIRSPQATANSTGEPAVQRDTQQTAKTATGAASSQRKYLSRARSASAMELFEALMQRFEELDVADDGLMSRVTRQEFRMYFMTPIKETFHHLSYASWNVS